MSKAASKIQLTTSKTSLYDGFWHDRLTSEMIWRTLSHNIDTPGVWDESDVRGTQIGRRLTGQPDRDATKICAKHLND